MTETEFKIQKALSTIPEDSQLMFCNFCNKNTPHLRKRNEQEYMYFCNYCTICKKKNY